MKLSPLQRFVLVTLAWLPVCFFLWWWVASIWIGVPVRIAGFALTHLWPSVFKSVVQTGASFEVVTKILVLAEQDGRRGWAELILTPNPLVYGYSLPLYAALVLATPLSEARRYGQLLLGIGVIWLAWAFGMLGNVLKVVVYDSGELAAAAAANAGLAPTPVALCYQFGYLILPAIVPVLLWLGLNRPFTDSLTARQRKEPGPGSTGQSPG